ncbi:MAG: hypothetical protein M1151_07130 [Candidatus Thermoplasmatota archaeon]|jgi:hypothetical protein|nr:hypothetical protein [Candidatus Thermoplasmatota archaeon]MCL5786416.1 hypothetical protein [Candidatus Thermoplasmatota archaeon]
MSEKYNFSDLAVWNEDSIGLVVIRSSEIGEVRRTVFSELIMALGIASTDDSVNAVALAGLNANFVNKIDFCSDLKCVMDDQEMFSGLVSMVYSFPKPLYAILTGDALDIGYEIAAISDCIIAADDVRAGITQAYSFRLCGSLSTQKFRDIRFANAKPGSNVDIVFTRGNLLGDAKKYILSDVWASRPLMRRRRLGEARSAILEEHRLIVEKISRTTQEQGKSAAEAQQQKQ